MNNLILKSISCLLVFMLIGIMSMQAENHQNKVVTGTIYDDNDSSPLIGVTVAVKGTNQATMTDLEGNFSLPISTSKATLVISYVGYKSEEVQTDGLRPVIVRLRIFENILKETVVIGYGSTSKKEITGSISSLKEEDFNKGVFTDAMGLLQGKVAGLSVVKSGGANPQADYEIILRGTGTLTATQSPLIIIDGVAGESLKNINFEEIESMDILKDGSAAAIYGTRGTNGVIIITTKRARSGKTTIEYSGQGSIQVNARKVKNLNAQEFTNAINTYAPEKASNIYGSDTDWFDEITRSTPFSHRHSVAISGGTQEFSHRTTLNVEQNQGLLRDNDVNKYLFKTNIIQDAFGGRLKLDMNATYSKRDYHPANNDLFYQAFINNPTAPVYDPSNTAAGGYHTFSGALEYYNPVAMLNERKRSGVTDDFTGSGKATIKLLENLTWSNMFTYANSSWEDRSYKTRYYPGAAGRNGEAEISNGRYQNKQYDMLFNYNENFGKHALQALAGYSFQEESNSTSSMSNSGFDTDLYESHNIGAGAAIQKGGASMSSYKDRNRLVAFFGRAMYNYDERYLLSLSMRREGSSRFGKNNKWGWFPAISAGWRINKESFLEDNKTINDLKLRVGYGVTGNQGFSNYRSLMLMGKSGSFYYDGKWINSYQPVSNAEPDLKWEMKHEYNVGVDFAVLDNRLSGTVDVYYRKIKDLLYSYSVPVPPYPHDTKFTNVGGISNKGIEITITGVPIKTKDLEWSSSATFAKNTNKLDKLSNSEFSKDYVETGWVGGDITVNTQRMIEGKSIGLFYGPKWIGIDELGRDLYKNADPIGQVHSKDWEKIGDANPDFTLGWSNNVTYKNWNLGFALRASIGGDVLNTYRLYYENWSAIGQKNIIHTQYEKPQFTGKAAYSSKYIEDATFLKMDNITLGYNVPIRYKYISKMQLSLTAQDVFCITSYKGLDPEVSLSGITPGIEYLSYYPRTTSITMGVNITF